MSFTRYTTPDSAQKIDERLDRRDDGDGSNSRRPNSRPAKTSRFFVHWPGRSETSRLTASGRRPDVSAVRLIGAS